MIPNGLITELSREDIHLDTAISDAAEIMLFGGKKVVPILKLDGNTISEEAGPVARSFQEYLQNKEAGTVEITDLTPFNIDIPS